MEPEAYKVVVNDEEQYSIWPLHRDTPAGWREAGTEGSREECLAWIEENWTDMRPASLRGAAEASAG
jgi:MbtH protein